MSGGRWQGPVLIGLLVAGAEAAPALAEEWGVPAVLVRVDGTTTLAGGVK